MSALTTASKSSLPAAPTRELTDLVGRLSNALEYVPGSHRAEICSACIPTLLERQALTARGQELEQALVRATEAEIGRMVSTLRAAFPAPAGNDPTTARLTVKMFQSALEAFPAWAISEACRRVLEGRAGINTAFAPTPPQMAEICREIVAPFLAERAKISALLTAKVYTLPTDEERQRVADGLAALVEDLKRIPDDRKQDKAATNQSFIDASQRLIKRQLALAGVSDGITMSLEMRAKIEEMAYDKQYDDLVNAAYERRQGMSNPVGGKDDEDEGSGVHDAGSRADAGAGDVRDV